MPAVKTKKDLSSDIKVDYKSHFYVKERRCELSCYKLSWCKR